MQIPEHQVEEIRLNTDIVDLVSGYVQLRKRGRNYIGLCPFHNEKTPSFTVSPDKQIYHCFGCHAGGNAYKFLMEYKNISFVESVQELAENLGIKLEENSAPNTEEKSEFEELYEINVMAAKIFSNNLLKSSSGEVARDYFKNRKIKPKTNTTFGLGYALPEWDKLLQHLTTNKVNLQKAKDIGLIDVKDNGGFYDKYRGRTIFPIFSPNGRVIGFGGRVFQGEENTAKYLNSPESTIYLKRKSLYGLFHSKDEIRKQNKAILVEGYMDVIALYQHGIKNVIASSGTSLTEEQVRLLSRYTKNIVVIFDADTAGKKAALKSIEILLKQDFEVNVLSLPDGEDPDSYVNNFGQKQFEEKIITAKNFLEFQTNQYKEDGMFENPGTEAEAIRELVKSASLVNDELKRSLLLKSISKKFNLREKLLESELNKFLAQYRKDSYRKSTKRNKTGKPKAEVQEDNLDKKFRPIEKKIIELLFEGDEKIMDKIFDTVLPEDFTNKTLGSLAQIVYDSYLAGKHSTASMIEKITDEELRNYILSLSLSEYQISNSWHKRASSGEIKKDPLQYSIDLVKKYQLLKIDEQINSNDNKIENLGNSSEVLELMKINDELRKEKISLQLN